MDIKIVLFYAFSALMLFAAFRVITARNPVHAALYLVLAFFQAASIWLLLKAEFLAITLVLVYVGAVMVLFLFVVMMLDVNIDGIRKNFWKHFPLAGMVGAIVALEMSYILMGGFREFPEIPNSLSVSDANLIEGQKLRSSFSNTKELGKLLYSEYIFTLEIAAVILLVAIIAAIALTLRERKDSKSQNPSDQVRVKRADRVSLVKVEPTMRGKNIRNFTEPKI